MMSDENTDRGSEQPPRSREEMDERTQAAVERARPEEALRRSEARLQRMVNVPRVGVLTFDYTGALLHANDAFLEMVGYDRAEFAARKLTWRDFTPSEYVEASMAVMEQLRETGRGGPYEKEYFRKDGSRTWLMFVAADLGDGTIVEYALDISDRKRIEEVLRESEEKFSAFVGATSEVIYEMSADWRKMRFLKGREFIVSTENPREDWSEEYIPEDEKTRVRAAINRAIESKSVFELEHRVIRLDGTVGWTFSRAVPLKDERGEILKWFGTASDITERKSVEEALAESEEKYRTLFDSIDEGFCIFELLFDEAGNAVDWIYTEANPAFERQTGYLNPIGQRISHFQPNLERSWFERFAEVARTGSPVRFVQYTEAMGIWYDVYALRVGTSGDNRVSLLFTDVTERKRHEANLVFLAEASQDLARLTSIDETMNRLGEKIGQFFGVKHCLFAEHADEFETSIVAYGWNAEDAPSLRGNYRMRDFLSDELMTALMTGEPLIVSETQRDSRVSAESYGALGIRSFIIVPLVREGEWRFQISIIDDKPRAWRDDEIELMRELTARIWARLERARAEGALRESEFRFRMLADNVAQLAWTCDQLGNVTWYNKRWLDYTGMTFEDMKGWDWSKVQHPEHLERVVARVKRSAETGQPWEDVFPLRGRDGQYRWFLSRATPIRDEEGAIYCWFGTNTDITERREVEEALRENKERLSNALRAAEMGSWRANLATGLGTRDANLNRILGHEAVETTQAIDDCFRLIHPDDKAAAVTAWQKAIDTRGIYETEFRLVREDGTIRWLREQGRFVAGEAGEADFVTGLTTDITVHKEAEERLRESEERFRALIDKGVDVITISDRAGEITYASPSIEAMSGYTVEEFTEQHPFSTIHPEDLPRCEAALKHLVNQPGESVFLQHRYRHRSGEWRWLEGTFTSRFHDPAVGGLVANFRDVTERKRAENVLKQSNERLEERVAERTVELMEMNTSLQAEIGERRRAEQERAQILRRLVMAQEDERRRIARDMHDQFGQQLTALLLKLGMLKEDCRGRAELCGQVESLESVARQLDRDVDFLVWELRPTVLDDLGLREALANFAQNWSEHFGVPVEVHTSGVGKERLTSEIETTLYRIAQEALNNVSKHARAASVSILLEQRTDFISLVVEDDGVGFESEEMFGANDKGLGLVGMRERAALVGGTTVIESRPGEGTTVIVRIPAPPVTTRGGPHV